MKRELYFFALVLSFTSQVANAKDYSFSWLPNPDIKAVDHYEICYGLTPQEASEKQNCIDVGNYIENGRVLGTLYDFPDNTLYFFTAITCNTTGCSDPLKKVASTASMQVNVDGDYDETGLKDRVVSTDGYLMIDFADGGFNGISCWDEVLYNTNYYETDIDFEDKNGICSVCTDYTMTPTLFYDNTCSTYVKIGVFCPSTRTFYLKTLYANNVITYGYPTDLPIAGDWDGNGIVDIGVFRPENRIFYLQTPTEKIVITYGHSTDSPITLY